jgi:hypothetical protein
MNHKLVLLFAFSIILPSAVAIVKLRKINKIYLPFLLCIWIGSLNEFISYLLIDIYHKSNSINTNIYCLVEALLFTWFFKNLQLFTNNKVYISFIVFFTASWLIENLIILKSDSFDSYFTIIYSLVIVLMSITILNRLIVSQINLLTNSNFLICAALIIYFTFLALVEIFWLYRLDSSASFRLSTYRIMAYINFSVNLIFALAILWMHRKQEFTPQP